MHPYPHRYTVAARMVEAGPVALSSAGLPGLASEPPPEFDGPGGSWSPETLLTAAVADCFVLTFRAISRASRFPWTSLECSTEGLLERVEGAAQFTRFHTVARLTVPAGTDEARARLLLEKAEHACLIANSLTGARSLEVSVLTG